MVWKLALNGFATRIEWFCNADHANGLETCIEQFCNTHRMILQHTSNGLQHTSNGFATRIEWFCNTDRTVWQHDSLVWQHTSVISARIVKVQSTARMRTVR